MHILLCSLAIVGGSAFCVESATALPPSRADVSAIESQLVALNRDCRLNEARAAKAKATTESLRGRADASKDPESKKRLEKALAKQSDSRQFHETLAMSQRQSIDDLAAKRHLALGENPVVIAPPRPSNTDSKWFTSSNKPIFEPDFTAYAGVSTWLFLTEQLGTENWNDLFVPRLPSHHDHVTMRDPLKKKSEYRKQFGIDLCGFILGDGDPPDLKRAVPFTEGGRRVPKVDR